jgi:hypothetical protein
MLSIKALGMPIATVPHAVYSWLPEEPAGFEGLKTKSERGSWMGGSRGMGLVREMARPAETLSLRFPTMSSQYTQNRLLRDYGIGALPYPRPRPSQNPRDWVRGLSAAGGDVVDFSSLPPDYASANAGLTDTSSPGIWDNAPAVTSPSVGSDIVTAIQAVAPIGAVIAKNVTTPVAQIAGPYGVSSIPITSQAQASSMLAGAGAGVSSLLSSPILLMGIVLVVMMGAMEHH